MLDKERSIRLFGPSASYMRGCVLSFTFKVLDVILVILSELWNLGVHDRVFTFNIIVVIVRDTIVIVVCRCSVSSAVHGRVVVGAEKNRSPSQLTGTVMWSRSRSSNAHVAADARTCGRLIEHLPRPGACLHCTASALPTPSSIHPEAPFIAQMTTKEKQILDNAKIQEYIDKLVFLRLFVRPSGAHTICFRAGSTTLTATQTSSTSTAMSFYQSRCSE